MNELPPAHPVDDARRDESGGFPGWENLVRGDVGRRTLIKGAAWSAPVIALTVATPLAAASTTLNYDLVVASLSTSGGYPFTTQPAYTSITGEPVYPDNRATQHWLILENHGDAEIPAGSTVTVSYPAFSSTGNPFLSAVGGNNTTPGISSSTVTPAGNATVVGDRLIRTFTIGVAIPVGTRAVLQFSFTVKDLGPGAYTGGYITATAALPSGLTDANPGNNTLNGPLYTIAG